MDSKDVWDVDDSIQPGCSGWGTEDNQVSGMQNAPGCILFDPQKNQYTSLHPFAQPTQKKIEDEIIDMSFLGTYITIPLTKDGGVVKYYNPKATNTPIDLPSAFINPDEFDNPEESLLPGPFARVRIRYEGRKDNGELTDKHRDRKQLKAFKLNGDGMIPGINHATASLKKGEIAWFKLLPEYHYGPKGAPPMIPENAILYYKIELTDFTNPKKQLANDDYDGRIEVLKSSREKGNAAFAAKDYDKALKEYKKGTETIKNLPKSLAAILDNAQKEELKDFQIKLANNALLTCIKRKDYKEGLQFAETVLNVDRNNAKCLFRKGQCLMELEYLNEALKVFGECIKNDTESKEEGEKMIKECQRRKDTRLKKEKKRYAHVISNFAEAGEKEESEKKIKEKIENKRARENMKQGGLSDIGGEVLKKVKVDQESHKKSSNQNNLQGGLAIWDNATR